jgi:hypothetical protein
MGRKSESILIEAMFFLLGQVDSGLIKVSLVKPDQ